MARLPRFILPGQPQHVIVRGNNREPVFYTDEDYRFYLEKLQQACVKHSCDLHAYVLMTNHVHLLITPQTEHGIGKAIQMLGRYYVQYFNHSHQRTGTLWEGRYKATLINSEQYLLVCSRYIELNPVRAKGMVNQPSAYRWSSYHYNALGKDDSLVTPHSLYKGLGITPKARQSAYRSLFKAMIPEQTLAEIRQATNKAWVLGDRDFKERIGNQMNRRVSPKTRGGDRKSKVYKEMYDFNRV
jgi:putative transposase